MIHPSLTLKMHSLPHFLSQNKLLPSYWEPTCWKYLIKSDRRGKKGCLPRCCIEFSFPLHYWKDCLEDSAWKIRKLTTRAEAVHSLPYFSEVVCSCILPVVLEVHRWNTDMILCSSTPLCAASPRGICKKPFTALVHAVALLLFGLFLFGFWFWFGVFWCVCFVLFCFWVPILYHSHKVWEWKRKRGKDLRWWG